jgi:hypothetical protein
MTLRTERTTSTRIAPQRAENIRGLDQGYRDRMSYEECTEGLPDAPACRSYGPRWDSRQPPSHSHECAARTRQSDDKLLQWCGFALRFALNVRRYVSSRERAQLVTVLLRLVNNPEHM